MWYQINTPCPIKRVPLNSWRQISIDFQNSFIGESEGNLQQNLCVISHLTLSMLPHYLWEFKSSNLAQIWKKMQTKNVT